MNIYVASSWRNIYQPIVVEMLRQDGHIAYDFKNPEKGSGFYLGDTDPDWQNWSIKKFIAKLATPDAQLGFERDFDAMKAAEIFVLVLPCGRAAHIEFGWGLGQGKPGVIYIPTQIEPELMYKLCPSIVTSTDDLRSAINLYPALPKVEWKK